jgi:hypothetical protein
MIELYSSYTSEINITFKASPSKTNFPGGGTEIIPATVKIPTPE